MEAQGEGGVCARRAAVGGRETGMATSNPTENPALGKFLLSCLAWHLALAPACPWLLHLAGPAVAAQLRGTGRSQPDPAPVLSPKNQLVHHRACH